MEHIQRLADLSRRWLTDVYGSFLQHRARLVTAEPGADSGIFDQFAYQEWEWRQPEWDAEKSRESGRWLLRRFIDRVNGAPARVMAEHHAVVSTGQRPFSWETSIARDVMESLVHDPELLVHLGDNARGWEAKTLELEHKVFLSVFRDRDNEADDLAGKALLLAHEALHGFAAAEYNDHAETLVDGEAHTWVEATTALLTEVALEFVEYRRPDQDFDEALRSALFAGYVTDRSRVDFPVLAYRYDSHAEAMRLVSLVGFENLLAAYFLGLNNRIAGPDSEAHYDVVASDATTEPPLAPPADVPPPTEAPPEPTVGDAAQPSAGEGVVLDPGWEWLADAALTGGIPTVPADWRAARPGAGRRYAVHLPTGMIAVASRPGQGTSHTVHVISYGWVPDGHDLVHQTTGIVLHGQGATIGPADPARAQRARDRAQSADRAVRDQARQLSRHDLLTWLLGHGGLEGPVPGLVSGAGWQPLTDARGGVQWVWNSPGATGALPPGLTRGTASGEGLRCLLDSLRQLMRTVLPASQREQMTVDFLRTWLDEHLPLGSEARAQLLAEKMVDVHSVLPVFTTMFQVRVQVFRHALNPGDFEWPGYQTIQPSGLQGPAVDQDGNPTPILRLYWRGHHFEPLNPPATDRVPRFPSRVPLGAGPS